MAKQRGLGRGLSALIKEAQVTPPAEAPIEEAVTQVPPPKPGVASIALTAIEVNPWQPRQDFEADPLDDLVSSIREHGVLQPLIVRPLAEGFQLIAGERRFRASKAAGLEEVPVIVREMTDQEALEIALIENLQREDLNIIEEAEGYQVLADRFKLTQEQISERVGKGRATIANALRLLTLTPECSDLVRRGKLSAGHAKALLGLDSFQAQNELGARIAKEGISVRATEAEVAKSKRVPKKPRTERPDIPDAHIKHLNEKIQQHLGTGTRLHSTRTLANGKKLNGKLEIDFYSTEDLDRLLGLLGIEEEL